MKKLLLFMMACLLVSCKKVPERPLPLQMTYAQRELSEQNNAVFALYLLSELEDSIEQMPADIQLQYELMKAEAEKMKQMQPVRDYGEEIRSFISHRDSLYQQQMNKERQAYEQQMQTYREQVEASNSLLWYVLTISMVAIIGVIAAWWLHKRQMRKRSQTNTSDTGTSTITPLFCDITLRLKELADKGEQPSAEEWEALRQHILQHNPEWEQKLHVGDCKITQEDIQLCLLSVTDLRPKQIATLLNVSQQNLRNLRMRLYAKVTGNVCSGVEEFNAWVK